MPLLRKPRATRRTISSSCGVKRPHHRAPVGLVPQYGGEQAVNRVAFEPVAAVIYRVHTLHQELGRHRFQHHALHPQPGCLQRLVFLQLCRQQDDPGGALLLAQFPEPAQASLAGIRRSRSKMSGWYWRTACKAATPS